MKLILLNLCCSFLLLSYSVQAQTTTEGVITYEIKQTINRPSGMAGPNAPNGSAKTIKPGTAPSPTYSTTKHVLIFNAQQSYFKPYVAEEEDLDMEGNTRFNSIPSKNETYIEANSFKKIAVKEYSGKIYLISDTLKILPWKFGKETKDILGYSCKQATYVNPTTKQTTVAWYTEKLRPSLGPESYCSLPGTILEIDTNSGNRVVRALSIDLRPLRKRELVEPTKGQKKTEKEYAAMVAEEMKKMSGKSKEVKK